eukprot:4202392-Amphidinium_carterae.2
MAEPSSREARREDMIMIDGLESRLQRQRWRTNPQQSCPDHPWHALSRRNTSTWRNTCRF